MIMPYLIVSSWLSRVPPLEYGNRSSLAWTETKAGLMSEILLEVKNFNVILDGSPILSRLGFSVAEGEFLTILSPNESGKTVLSRALLDLMPYDGELSWRKQPRIRCLPRGLDQIYLRDLPLTVKDFFALKKPNPGEVLKCLSLLGLEGGVLNKRAGHLSGGRVSEDVGRVGAGVASKRAVSG